MPTIAALALLTAAPAGRADTIGWMAGPAGGEGAGLTGSRISIFCPAGAYLVGLNARTGDRIDHVQPLCVQALADGRWNGQPFPAPGNGMGTSAGGWDNNVVCPQDYFIEGLYFGRHGNPPWTDLFLDRLQLVCATIAAPNGGVGVNMQGLFQPPVGYQRAILNYSSCWKFGTPQGTNIANGLFGRADAMVNQLAVYCLPFQGGAGISTLVKIKPKYLEGPITGTEATQLEGAVVAKPSTLMKSQATTEAAPPVAEPEILPGEQLLNQGMLQTQGQSTKTAAIAAGPRRFEAPTGPNGLRLYACPTVGAEDCASQQVADRFCVRYEGKAATGFEISRRSIAAETLQGETCSKKRCKVFDVIECQP
jgi:hypothetical protein